MDMTHNHWEVADFVVAQLQKYGYEGFIVGGAVRDILLGRAPKDFDIVTNATPEQIARIDTFEKASFTDPAQAFGVTRVKATLPDGAQGGVEVTTYRRDVEAHLGRKLTSVEFAHIEDDLERRDLTINALALDPHNDFLVDLHDGLIDLENGTVRFIGDPTKRIAEDPLRILRAVRFRNQLGFSYDQDTETALRQTVSDGKLDDIAIDRVFGELTRMLVDPNRRAAVEDMDMLGILTVFLPEVTAMKNIPQPKDEHSEGDVWMHSMLALGALPENVTPRLAWATLLHDIGKTPTYSPPDDDTDRIHFDSHFRVGGEMVREAFARLKAGKKLTEDVVWLVHYHLITDSFPTMKQSRKHHYMSHPAFADLLELHAADMRGSVAAKPEEDRDDELIAQLEQTFAEYKRQSEQKVPSLKETLGIDGHWVMKEFGISDGEQLGMILARLQEEFLDGNIKSEEDARKLATVLSNGL